jgi:hypothetical protein
VLSDDQAYKTTAASDGFLEPLLGRLGQVTIEFIREHVAAQVAEERQQFELLRQQLELDRRRFRRSARRAHKRVEHYKRKLVSVREELRSVIEHMLPSALSTDLDAIFERLEDIENSNDDEE